MIFKKRYRERLMIKTARCIAAFLIAQSLIPFQLFATPMPARSLAVSSSQALSTPAALFTHSVIVGKAGLAYLSLYILFRNNYQRPVGNVVVSVRMGATNIAIQAADGRGVLPGIESLLVTHTWDDVRRHLEAVGIEGDNAIQAASEQTIAYFHNTIDSVLKTHHVKESRVTTRGISFAGLVLDDIVNSTNMKVHFKRFKLKDALFPGKSVDVVNDGEAGWIGEHRHVMGKLRDTPGGTYIIVGTGVGGYGRFKSGDVDAEHGHTLLYNVRTQAYEYHSTADLKTLRFFDGAAFTLPPSNRYDYFEHRVAGPWTALRFLSELDGPSLHSLAVLLTPKLEEVGLDHPNAEIQTLVRISHLSLDKWGELANPRTVRAVNEFINHPFGTDKQLRQRAEQANDLFTTELEKAIGAYVARFPDQPVVLGSGMVEARRENPNFVRRIEAIGKPGQVRLSVLNSSRENSAFVAAVHPWLARFWAFQSNAVTTFVAHFERIPPFFPKQSLLRGLSRQWPGVIAEAA